jgi:ubiquinone biosynthesis protein UbiJ
LISKQVAKKLLDAIYHAEMKCHTKIDTLRSMVTGIDLEEALRDLEKMGLVRIEGDFVYNVPCIEIAKAVHGISRQSRSILKEVDWRLLEKYLDLAPDPVLERFVEACEEAKTQYPVRAFLSRVSKAAVRVYDKIYEKYGKGKREETKIVIVRECDFERIIEFARQFRTFEDFEKAFEKQAVCGVKDGTMVFGTVPERVVEDYLKGGPQKKMVARKEMYSAIGAKAVVAVGEACKHFLERCGITLEDIWTKYLGRTVGPKVEEKKPETLEEYVRRKAYEVIGSAVLKYFEPVLDSLVRDIAEKAAKLPEEQREEFIENELKKFFDEITVNYVPLLKAAGRYKSYESFSKAVRECIVCGIPEETPDIVVIGLLPRNLCEKCKAAKEECIDEVLDRFGFSELCGLGLEEVNDFLKLIKKEPVDPEEIWRETKGAAQPTLEELKEYVRQKTAEAIGAEKLEEVKDEFEAFVERTAKKAIGLPEGLREAFIEENIEKFKSVVTTIEETRGKEVKEEKPEEVPAEEKPVEKEEIEFVCRDPEEFVFPDPNIPLTFEQIIVLGGVQVYSVRDQDPENPLIATYELPKYRCTDIYCESSSSAYINELLAVGFKIVGEEYVRYYVRPTKEALGKFSYVKAESPYFIGALFWKKVKCKDYVRVLEEKEALRRAVEEYRREKREKRKAARVELERWFEKEIEEEVKEIVRKIQIEVTPPKEWARELGKIIAQEIVKALKEYLTKS